MALSIEVRETTVVKLSGRLDTETAPAAEEQFNAIAARSPRHVVFDLAELEFMTSAGLRALFLARRALTGKGATCYLLNPQPQIARVIEIAKALPDMRVFKNTAELDEYLAAVQSRVKDGD